MLMAACGVLVVIGLIAVIRWGSSAVRPPAIEEPPDPSPRAVLRRYVWYATGLLYLLIRRWLPGGRLGGLVYGLFLLVLVATRIDPLRADTPDFDIVGPGWVAVVVFGTLVVVQGMLVAAIAGRYSGTLPLISKDRRALLPYAPLLVLAPVPAAVVLLVLAGGVVVLLGRSKTLIRSLGSRPLSLGGRFALAAASLIALPGSLSALVDIAGRTP